MSDKNGESLASFNNISGDTHLIPNIEEIGFGVAEILDKIETTTLDDLVFNIIDLKNSKLLKIEVEGMEP